MSTPLTIHPDAQREVEEAYAYYESRQPGLGENFIMRLDAALERVAVYHKSYRFVFDAVKKVLLHRFPYMVLFKEQKREILIAAVMHGARNPKEIRYIVRSRW